MIEKKTTELESIIGKYYYDHDSYHFFESLHSLTFSKNSLFKEDTLSKFL